MRFVALVSCSVVLSACSGDGRPAGVGGAAGGGATPGSVPGTGGSALGGGGALAAGGTSSAGGAAPTTGAPSLGGTPGLGSGGASSSTGAQTSSSGGGGEVPPSGGASSGGAANGGAPSGGSPNGGGGGTPPGKQQLAVTADFLNQTLSIVDVAKLTQGSTRDAALIGTVDLSKYAPGPLDLAITPDGKTALVAVSGGWLSAFTTVPPGNGTLLFVDIATRAVTGELYTGASPMGIVITKDGKRAFVGQYSETYFAIVDIEKRTFSMVQTGSAYNEELAMDDSGSVGILSYGPAGDCVTFSVDDPTGTRGMTLGLTGDAGGVAFFPGTKTAFVVQAPTALTGNVGGHNVVDVSNPKSPVASDNVRINASPIWYPVTAVPSRNSVAYSAQSNNELSVIEVKLDGTTAKTVQTVDVGPAMSLAYGIEADARGRFFGALPQDHAVVVVDLTTAKSVMVPWGITQSGPTDIALIP